MQSEKQFKGKKTKLLFSVLGISFCNGWKLRQGKADKRLMFYVTPLLVRHGPR
jgi:hypothetical protein